MSPAPPAAASDALSSSVSLIRALKSGTLSSAAKVDLASRAWLDTALYVPGKRDALLEWVLSDMSSSGKGKAKATSNE